MKDGIHPQYHPVVFVDTGASAEFVTRSTMRSKETREIDGVEHFVIRLDVSSASHPFFTGKQRFVDAAGRIDKFRSKYGSNYGGRAKKQAAGEQPAAEQAATEQEGEKADA
jgi:large subunit ribosomal protein L31